MLNDFASNNDVPVQQHHSGSSHLQTLRCHIIGEKLTLDCEDTNQFNRRAIAVMKSGEMVGHMPCAMGPAGITCFMQRVSHLEHAVAVTKSVKLWLAWLTQNGNATHVL